MIQGVISTSILRQKAEKSKYKSLARAPHEGQLAIFRATLRDLDSYLDTSELQKLRPTSLKFILNDILEVIKGVRDIKEKVAVSPVDSLEGTLEELRLARDSIQVAQKMFGPKGELNASQTKKLLAEMRYVRKRIEETLKHLEPV